MRDMRFGGPNEYLTRISSPDGQYVWLVSPSEWANSQWVLAGQLWRKESEECLFDPPDDWSFEGRKWTSPRIREFDVDALSGSIEADMKDTRVDPRHVPAAPSDPQPFVVLCEWLAADPK